MKTIRNRSLRFLTTNNLTILIILIMLVGLSLKSKAQSTKIGNDLDALKTSMTLQVNNSDLSILIPKVKEKTLQSMSETTIDQLVYVNGTKSGFYRYEDDRWVKISIKEALASINNNVDLYPPSPKNIILSNSAQNPRAMLDYNGHILEMNESFGGNSSMNNYAVRLND